MQYTYRFQSKKIKTHITFAEIVLYYVHKMKQ